MDGARCDGRAPGGRSWLCGDTAGAGLPWGSRDPCRARGSAGAALVECGASPQARAQRCGPARPRPVRGVSCSYRMCALYLRTRGETRARPPPPPALEPSLLPFACSGRGLPASAGQQPLGFLETCCPGTPAAAASAPGGGARLREAGPGAGRGGAGGLRPLGVGGAVVSVPGGRAVCVCVRGGRRVCHLMMCVPLSLCMCVWAGWLGQCVFEGHVHTCL